MVASGSEPARTAAFLTLGLAVFFVLFFFFSDFDAKIGQVILIMETLRRHTWGAIPVPAF